MDDNAEIDGKYREMRDEIDMIFGRLPGEERTRVATLLVRMVYEQWDQAAALSYTQRTVGSIEETVAELQRPRRPIRFAAGPGTVISEEAVRDIISPVTKRLNVDALLRRAEAAEAERDELRQILNDEAQKTLDLMDERDRLAQDVDNAVADRERLRGEVDIAWESNKARIARLQETCEVLAAGEGKAAHEATWGIVAVRGALEALSNAETCEGEDAVALIEEARSMLAQFLVDIGAG